MSIRTVEQYSVGGGYYNLKDKLAGYVYDKSEECFKNNDNTRQSIKTKSGLEVYADEMRSKFINAAGGIPYDPSLPLNAKITGVVEEKDLRIEKILFESRQDVFVTANLYIPRKRKNPCGAVLFQCGHSELGKAYPRYQRIIRMIASAGVIVLSIDPFGQGERYSYAENGLDMPMIQPCVHDHQYSGNQCFLVGDSPMRYFIGDAMRAVDYLQSRPEVDPTKIGASGSSGGGTMTTHIMVCDKRIAAAAPGTFVTNRREYIQAGGAQDAEQIWLGGTAYGFDHNELAMCFAPKPLLILAVDYDFFPIEGARTVYAECKRFWQLYGKDADFELYTDSSEHCFTDNLGKRAASFFARVLNNEERNADLNMAEPIEPSVLLATSGGQVATEIPGAKFIFDENKERFERLKLAKQGMTEEELAKEAAAFLRKRLDFNRVQCGLNTRILSPMYENGLMIQPVMWFSQRFMPCFGLEFRDFRKKDEKLPVTICLWDNGTDYIEGNIALIRSICASGKAAFVADLSGMGKCAPHDLNYCYGAKENYGVIDRLTKDLFFLNDSLCALRAYDLERTVNMLRTLDSIGDVSIYAKGNCAVYARIAHILDKSLPIETDGSFNSLSDIVRSKYYEDYNIWGIIMPGLALYF